MNRPAVPVFRNALLICLCTLSIVRVDAADFERDIQPILKDRCITCHSTEKQTGELDLQRFGALQAFKTEPQVLEGMLEQLNIGEMPPHDAPQLSAGQKQMLVTWLRETLDAIALANAGDPGPVALRRLSNWEYTYTIRDLTGVDSLNPAAEFPVDGAAGEGFTNASAALVMSPALLTKYLDAAKEIASHAVLTPDGIRFSASPSPRDWTDEALGGIRRFYVQFSAEGNATAVNLQGIQFDTNAGGRLPVERYLAALQGQASAEGLNKKYLARLRQALEDSKPSLLLDPLREKFRNRQLTPADIQAWQQSLWRFTSVGHIGKKDGPKAWQEEVTPLVSQHELRIKLAAPPDGSDVTLYLITGDAGDGSEGDMALWENPRILAPGRVELPLRDVRAALGRLDQQRRLVTRTVTSCLAAAHEAEMSTTRTDVPQLAKKHGVDSATLAGWLDYLGIGTAGDVKLTPLLTQKLESTPDYNFIKGWIGEQALGVLANSSDATVRVPGVMKGHSVATHPSPSLASVIAWRSPVTGPLKITGNVQHAHPECGNGVTWSVELLRGHTREVLASGTTQGATPIPLGPFEQVRMVAGDVVALVIGPRDGNHSCDLTAVDLTLHDGQTEWDLARDVSPDILAGNPHPDRHGRPDVWHFFSRPATAETAPTIPSGSVLAQWRKSGDALEREKLAQHLQQLLERGRADLPAESANRVLYDQLLSYNSPLLAAVLRASSNDEAATSGAPATDSPYGLDPALFGKHPDGAAVAATSLCVQAPSVVELKLPASLVDGGELVVTGRLHSPTDGSVQMQVLTSKPASLAGIAASQAKTATADGLWSDNNLRTQHAAPVIVNDGSPTRRRFEAAFDEFRNLFPIALCYTKIVPVDEVVTLTLFYREDDVLKRLMLDETQIAEIDRLWDELRYVSEAPLKQVDAFEQLYQFATQDADPSAFEPLREPIQRDAAAFKQQQLDAEPRHVSAVIDFAAQAWRRPLTDSERSEFRELYQSLRTQELPHAAAVRMLLARVLVAPAFLYRGEQPASGVERVPVTDWELATRLSYFLWASAPDAELRSLAAAGQLRDPETVVAQTRRMLKDSRIRRLAVEFGCQWLHVRDVETLDEKSERHFPTFVDLRDEMQEETVRFFMELFQEDRNVLSLLDADHTFVNGPLAKHYGLEIEGDAWQRVDGLRARGRGGMLGFAATLAKQSGASRTSPILRGTWLSEVILGEKLPNPPQGVPVLPDEAPQGLTERQLTERHSSDVRCAGCHRRIDPFGFALEGFDAIGRLRTKDAAGLEIDTRATLPDGTEVEGFAGLREYLVTRRRDDFVRQFCRKLLGYALGRSVQLSDKPLLDSMLAELKHKDYRVSAAIELIVRSPQFRHVRGRDFVAHD